MINVYRKGGPFSLKGQAYAVESIPVGDLPGYLKNGWHPFLADALQDETQVNKPLFENSDKPDKPVKAKKSRQPEKG